MKKILAALSVATLVGSSATAQVWISELMANSPGSDSTASVGYELFELRGTPSLSLAGYYLLSLEGQGTTGKGDINQFFDLGAFSLGANGYLVGLQNGSPFTPTAAGATVMQNSGSQGWGQANTAVGSTIGHNSDGSQLDFENSATTVMLVSIGSGAAPTLATDLDADNDGVLELPTGWTIADSVGLMDGASAAAGDVSYGAITFRIGGLGAAALGNIIDVAAGPTTSLYVARKGESTGSTANDWLGAVLGDSNTMPWNLATPTDPAYVGLPLADMVFGGPSAIPEPGTLAFLSLGLLAILGGRRNR